MLCHDPRISDDREHRVETDNPVLIAAELQRVCYPELEISWERVTKMADISDEPMPWCEHCQCYHHDTAEHINRGA
jgi:hypothetical protein